MKINSVIIGAGVGIKHAEAINSIKGSKLIAICDKNKDKHNLIKRKFKGTKVLSNYKDIVFLKKKINLISIASYDSDHFEQLNFLSKICKNFIIEKPMVTTFDELIKLRKLVKKKKLKIFSNLVLREVRMFKFIKKNFDKNKIYYIEADYLWGRLYKLFEWRANEKNYSLTLGASIHMIDLVNWLIDDLPIKVFTKGNKNLTKNSSFKKFSFLTHFLEYKNGLIVKISANSGSIHPHFHDIKIFQKDKTFISNLTNQLLILKKQDKFTIKKTNLPYPDKKNRKMLIKNFIECLRNNTTIKPSFDYLSNLMQICFAADYSLKKKIEVKIKYFK